MAPKISDHFKDLAKADPRLPDQIARFVLSGDGPSVISTLQTSKVRGVWGSHYGHTGRRGREPLFEVPEAWSLDQARRLGEVLAAARPLTHDYGYFATKVTPEWLRHLLTVWLGHGRKGQPIDMLLALTDQTQAPVIVALDVLLTRDPANYRLTNSLERFAGVKEWLVATPADTVAAARELGADQRAELLGAIGRLELQATYLDMLMDGAAGSSKKSRVAARQALSGMDQSALSGALEAQFSKSPASRQAELVEVAATALGEAAVPLLAKWREGAGPAKVQAALDRVAGAVAPTAASAPAGRPSPWHADGPSGYAAVDGTWVETLPQAPLPDPGEVPADLLRSLDPAVDEFNRLWLEDNADTGSSLEKQWRWSRNYKKLESRDLEKLAAIAESTEPSKLSGAHSRLEWLRLPQLKHPAIARFLDDPRLSLHHLVRLGVASSAGNMIYLFGDHAGPVGAAIHRRVESGVDIRSVFELWEQAGGRDQFRERFTNQWHRPLPDLGVPMWPLLCHRFPLLDEALGLTPQGGEGPPLLLAVALETLQLFPRLPERYRSLLMLLAGDSSARLRQAARTLLRGTPGIGASIALQLQDGQQETRALAAEWLASRNDVEQIPPIQKALKGEKSDAARAAMITALQRLGADVSVYFNHAAMVKEANAGLTKYGTKGPTWLPFDHLPPLRWSDGSAVDPALPRWWLVLATRLKQPGGTALINLWLDRLRPDDAQRLGWLVLSGWIDEDTRTPTDEEANIHAQQHVDATLQQNIAWAQRYPQSADYFPTDRNVVFALLKRAKAGTYLGSAVDSKGVLALATRVNGADAAQRIHMFLKDHGARVSQAKALLELLAAIGTGPALQRLLAAANRSKQKTVQAHAAALVEQVAERNGWTPAQLSDRTVPTGGFDLDGTQELECGNDRIYRLQLDAQDAVIILNAEGREVKALPAARVDEERPAVEAAKKRLATARKEVKQVLAAQAERLQESMCLQRAWPRAEWESFIAGHPIVGRLAARLAWQGVDVDGNPLATFRPLGDGSYSDAADGDVDIAPLHAIRLAHSSTLDKQVIAAWRAHLVDYSVESPFDQLTRDLPQLTKDQGKSRTIDDREGWMIESFKLRGLATRLGYQRGPAQDGGWFLTYEKTYRDAELVAEIEFTGSPLPEASRQVALQALNFRKLRSGSSGGLMTLADVPPVLLAECWRDLHDIADKGTGFDPDWQKKSSL